MFSWGLLNPIPTDLISTANQQWWDELGTSSHEEEECCFQIQAKCFCFSNEGSDCYQQADVLAAANCSFSFRRLWRSLCCRNGIWISARAWPAGTPTTTRSKMPSDWPWSSSRVHPCGPPPVSVAIFCLNLMCWWTSLARKSVIAIMWGTPTYLLLFNEGSCCCHVISPICSITAILALRHSATWPWSTHSSMNCWKVGSLTVKYWAPSSNEPQASVVVCTRPPGWEDFSNRLTSRPALLSVLAQASPESPAPIMATLLPVDQLNWTNNQSHKNTNLWSDVPCISSKTGNDLNGKEWYLKTIQEHNKKVVHSITMHCG